MDIKGEINRNTVTVGDFNPPLTLMDKSSRQKINKKTVGLKEHNRSNGFNGYLQAFHHKVAEYTYFSSAHGMFARLDHMLGHKISLNKLKKIKVISSIFSDHNVMKLEINHKTNTEKHTKTSKLNNMLLNNECDNNEIKEEIRRYLETNENEHTTIQNL